MVADVGLRGAAPFVMDLLEFTDGIMFDRKNAEDKKNLILKTFKHFKDFKAKHTNSLFIYPEGYLCQKDHMLEFKPGAFVCLEGVQPVIFNYNKDFITNIDISVSRPKLVDIFMWAART